jgi:hypothetical protein
MFDIYVFGDEGESQHNEQYKQRKPLSSSAVVTNVALGTLWSGSY